MASYWPKSQEPEYRPESIQKKMLKILSENAGWRMFFAQNGINWLEVVYEDLLQHPENIMQQVVHHIAPEYNLQPKTEIASAGVSKQRRNTNEIW